MVQEKADPTDILNSWSNNIAELLGKVYLCALCVCVCVMCVYVCYVCVFCVCVLDVCDGCA